MNRSKKVSDAVIKRLPRYYRHLSALMESGVERISSKELAARMNITASQVRQDLNNFGGFGHQGYGYNVNILYREIGAILGLGGELPCIMAGAGHLGTAIINYKGFASRGFVIKKIFDIDENIIGKEINGIEIMHIKDMQNYIRDNSVEIAMLCVPHSAANEIVKCAVEAGIKGIWNFSYHDISVPDGVAVVNVHLSDSLMTLSYKINEIKNKGL